LLSDQAGGGVFYGCCCSAKYELRAKPEAAMLRVTTRSTLQKIAFTTIVANWFGPGILQEGLHHWTHLDILM